jgi:hypothetical protein
MAKAAGSPGRRWTRRRAGRWRWPPGGLLWCAIAGAARGGAAGGRPPAVRIKEVAAVQGVRSNQLVGYGLVVGLDGTGDQTTQTPFTTQSLNACCSRWA